MKTDIGLAGMGVMGTALARNIGSKKHTISLYNRHVKESEEGVAQNIVEAYDVLQNAHAFEEVAPFVASIEKPRKVLLTLTAGPAIDQMIDQLLPHLESGDLIIDGGNSHFLDTERRMKNLLSKKILFLGLGISGGQAGALNGPSLMAGGPQAAYDLVRPVLMSIAAQTPTGEKTCGHVGDGGAGHFVKMIHNAIEYGEMQCIAEHFEIMNQGMNMSYESIATVFEKWNKDEFESYLLEITIKILRSKDRAGHLIDLINDKASYNQTGSWALSTALDNFHNYELVASALFSRYVSNQKDDRIRLSQYKKNNTNDLPPKTELLKASFRFCRIINHFQSFRLIDMYSKKYSSPIDLGELCTIWSAGCIIRSRLLAELKPLLGQECTLFFGEDYIHRLIGDQASLAWVVSQTATTDIPVPFISAAFTYFKQMTQERSSAHIIQAQRDFFGAHGFEKLGGIPGQLYHHQWDS
ncbi:MAG: NADP-dependent phosphogluconate dehydrogenase [Flavobacteriia bacterium]|nr:NADP-dependent phosphogluconate dehydrogenase [Flavobacteriia bacterium]